MAFSLNVWGNGLFSTRRTVVAAAAVSPNAAGSVETGEEIVHQRHPPEEQCSDRAG